MGSGLTPPVSHRFLHFLLTHISSHIRCAVEHAWHFGPVATGWLCHDIANEFRAPQGTHLLPELAVLPIFVMRCCHKAVHVAMQIPHLQPQRLMSKRIQAGLSRSTSLQHQNRGVHPGLLAIVSLLLEIPPPPTTGAVTRAVGHDP